MVFMAGNRVIYIYMYIYRQNTNLCYCLTYKYNFIDFEKNTNHYVTKL